MPPVLALAPLAGSLLGAEVLPGLAGLLGADLGGAGLLGSTLGSTLGTVGGALGGGAAGALADKKDPLLGGILGAVGGGIGGPDLAGGLNSAVSGVGDLLSGTAGAAGTAASGAATAAPTSILPAAGVGSGAAATGAGAAAPGGAAAIAAPAAGAAGSSAGGLDSALSSFQPDIAGGAGSATPGASLAGAGNTLANAGSGGTASIAPSTAGGTTGDANTFDALLNDPTLKNFGRFAGANKDLITGGIGLAANAIRGDQAFPGEKQLTAQAKALSGQANSFMRGELTPGMQAGLRGATESAKAALRSMFAQRGMSGSSSEVEALASIDQTSAVKGAELAQSLIQQGVSEAGLASNLWQTILAESMRKDQELGSAIGGFASALAGGGGPH